MRIELQTVVTSITAKKDGSLGLRMATPELSTDEKAVILELQNKNLKTVVETVDEPIEETFKIDREINQKTASQRLRAVLFIRWQQKENEKWQDFEAYYNYEMERMIDNIKNYLE